MSATTPTSKTSTAKSKHPTPSLANVFDKILAEIVSGRYAPGTRLPAERDLSRSLAASRPTLREALRRLQAWGLIEARRGSGVIVRDQKDWSLDVLPSYIRLGAPSQRPGTLVLLIRDLLDIRRLLFLDVLRLVGPRILPDSLADARASTVRAWSSRGDMGQFVKEDFEAVRGIAHAGRFLPAIWLLNGLANIYLELGRTLTGAAMVPDDYLETYSKVLTALERRQVDVAVTAMATYLENHDRRLLAAMGVTR
jgi:GntR family transcriptional regulator, transcriptional repressor for pyruvate dehydrogenase complex